MLKRLLAPSFFFLFLLCLIASAPRERAANQFSRFNQVRAMVVDHVFYVDRYAANTMDNAEYGGHVYSNKAPGTALLAVPIFAVNYYWQKFFAEGNWTYWNLWWCDFFSTNLPAAWLIYMMVQLLLLWRPDSPGSAWRTGIAYGLGTSAFPFSMTMFGHQTAAAFGFACFYYLEVARIRSLRKYYFFAGLFGAFGFACDTSLLLLSPLVLFWLWHYGKFVKLFFLGTLAPLLFLGFYQWACFGNPFVVPSQYNSAALPIDWTSYPLFGQFGLPKPEIFARLWFGLDRGAFVFAPILLCAIFGWKKMLARMSRDCLCFCLLPMLLLTLFFSAYIGWHGGGSSGPRYLLPALPFWILPLVFVNWTRPLKAVLALSICNSCAVLAVTVLASGDHFVLGEAYKFVFTDVYFAYDFVVLAIGSAILYWLGTRTDWGHLDCAADSVDV